MPKKHNQNSDGNLNNETFAEFAFRSGIANSQRIDLIKSGLKQELRLGASSTKQYAFYMLKRIIKDANDQLENIAEKIAVNIEKKTKAYSPKARTSKYYKKSY
jgi:hypothetical protein